MKTELSPLDYELLMLFKQLSTEEKLIVLEAGQVLSSEQPSCVSPVRSTA